LAEGLTFAERLGLDPGRFLEVAKGSASQSQVMETKGPKMVAREYSPQGFVTQHLKDVRLMLDQAKALGQELPLTQLHRDVLEACVRAGEAERDNSIIVEEIRRRRR
jgi:3-hydroxyisobutyrate dehydrogenase-like beta-hydroxyacid dehydrogenase